MEQYDLSIRRSKEGYTHCCVIQEGAGGLQDTWAFTTSSCVLISSSLAESIFMTAFGGSLAYVHNFLVGFAREQYHSIAPYNQLGTHC